MKILALHCDYIKFQALKKALKSAEDLKDKDEKEVKECLVVLTSVEKGDSKEQLESMLQAVRKTAKEVKADNIVLYPYAHLSSNLANPETALDVLTKAEKDLKKDFKVSRAPFGYYKSFELKCKGHPLAESSKEFKSQSNEEGEVYDHVKLLHEISKTKLDTSKLKDNDHRIIGQRLDLFSFNEISPGSVFWHNNGQIIYNELVSFLRTLLNKFEYQEVSTPQILENKLWKISGHWDHYKNNMFITDYEKRDFGVKPMNCPGGIMIYKSRPRSYRELPIRMAEFGTVHRKELSGVLNGLFRVIRFTQDDGHIFCNQDQIKEEIEKILEMIKIIYNTFKFDYSLELSTRPEKFMGEKKDWDYTEKVLEDALKKAKIKYKVNKGDGAFYGPKIDIHIKDSLGRSWQCATIQLDVQMPQRFDINYVGEDNKEHRPIMIHRAILGSVERFIGILLEHTNGNLPLWISPKQIRIINFTDRNTDACNRVLNEIKTRIPGVRIDTDYRTETVQAKIRDAELQKINYILVIGDKEEQSDTLAVRARGQKPKFEVKIEDFIEDITKELILR